MFSCMDSFSTDYDYHISIVVWHGLVLYIALYDYFFLDYTHWADLSTLSKFAFFSHSERSDVETLKRMRDKGASVR